MMPHFGLRGKHEQIKIWSVFVNGRKPRLDDRIQNGDALLVLETDDAALRAAGEA
jgi:hypothetical protein